MDFILIHPDAHCARKTVLLAHHTRPASPAKQDSTKTEIIALPVLLAALLVQNTSNVMTARKDI